MVDLVVNWNKCHGDVWCNLGNVNLEHPHFLAMDGVYIIWHGGNPSHTVCVGHGNIRDRLLLHRREVGGVQAYGQFNLFVTWAAVDPARQEGVVNFLSRRLTPLVPMQQRSDAVGISVNLPWP